MVRESPQNVQVAGWLKTLGIESLCQWDVLVFLHHHPTSLVNADFIAPLVGCATEQVVAAFDNLESFGLVARSRVYQNVRVYQFTVPSAPQRGNALEQLFALADSRAGRVVLSKILRAGNRTPQEGLQAAPALP